MHGSRWFIERILIGLVFHSLCSSNAFGAAAASKYVVGYATFTARIVPLWLAQEQGFFAKYGIDVDPVFIRGAPTLVAGLASGSIHIGRTGGSAMLAAREWQAARQCNIVVVGAEEPRPNA